MQTAAHVLEALTVAIIAVTVYIWWKTNRGGGGRG